MSMVYAEGQKGQSCALVHEYLVHLALEMCMAFSSDKVSNILESIKSLKHIGRKLKHRI